MNSFQAPPMGPGPLLHQHAAFICWGCQNNGPQTEGSNKSIHCLSVPEARNPRSRCCWVGSSTVGFGGEFVPCVSPSFCRVYWQSSASLASRSITPIPVFILMASSLCASVCVSVPKFLLFIRTSVILYLGLTLLQYDLISTNDFCNDTLPKKGQILRY